MTTASVIGLPHPGESPPGRLLPATRALWASRRRSRDREGELVQHALARLAFAPERVLRGLAGAAVRLVEVPRHRVPRAGRAHERLPLARVEEQAVVAPPPERGPVRFPGGAPRRRRAPPAGPRGGAGGGGG